MRGRAAPRARALPRVLDAPGVTVLASASMGPAYSLASTLGPMAAAAGPRTPLALALLSALMLGVAIGFARLARTHPDAGSSYGWARTAFGPFVGAYAAWLLLLSNFFAVLATALPAGSYLLEVAQPSLASRPLAVALVAVGWIVVSAVLLSAGMRPTARVSLVFLVVEIVVVIASALAVRLHGSFGVAPHAALGGAGFVPTAGGFATAMVLGIWMSDGWEVSASASEETTEAHASGRGGIAGLVLTTIVLLGAIVAYGRVGPSVLASDPTDALAAVGGALGGAWPAVLTATVLVSTAATLWTTILYLSRSLYAMGRSGLAPCGLGELDAFGSPQRATFAVAAATGLCTLATGLVPSFAQALTLVLGGTSVFLGLLFVLSVAAGVRLCGVRAPLTGAIVPGIGGAGLLTVVVLTLVQADPPTRAIELGGLAAGLPLAWWRGRASTRR